MILTEQFVAAENSTKPPHTTDAVFRKLTILKVQYAVTIRSFLRHKVLTAVIIAITIHQLHSVVETRYLVYHQELHVVEV